ncbi:DUF2630 family protein [Kitasatospora griseola]|uniref:DUF2630 domain-containing protein n=1 Tax=Kitasatospora griseola TaxID=2064 RepID=A0A0D0PS67_KITGR|nr:DUF2630 family protein [Kitasatospora griseola]KIQ65419.1 hypothetical protein TR51_16090 [Kitasatospora griseola]GGQ98641.1 hypothetical protein GCM10010195_63140 [Kitasatospora griseola]
MDEQSTGGADRRILDRISDMVETERKLRAALVEGRIDQSTEQRELKDLEEQLDQCWDLLRQRRARTDAGEDPNQASVRSVEEVERYES